MLVGSPARLLVVRMLVGSPARLLVVRMLVGSPARLLVVRFEERFSSEAQLVPMRNCLPW